MSRSSDSDSSNPGSFSYGLNQVGKLNLKFNLGSYLNTDNLPSMPQLPNFEMAKFHSFSNEFSNIVGQYLRESTFDALDADHEVAMNSDGEFRDCDPEHQDKRESFLQQDLVNSVKTVVSTRMQMNNFLSDLKAGFNFDAAIDRLQPLTDLINEVIALPVEDASDVDDNGMLASEPLPTIAGLATTTEPMAVDTIADSHQPLINEIIKPQIDGKRTHRRSLAGGAPDESGTPTSDLNTIDGLSFEEIKILSDLDSIADFAKQDFMRCKIQKIHGLKNINQDLKNKLVTRLMLSNYYTHAKAQFETDQEQLLVEAASPLAESMSMHAPSTHDSVSSDDEEVILTSMDQMPSWHDKSKKILGCSHYQKKCKVECATCLKWYPCRFCHDAAVSDHKMIRADIKHVLCMECNTPQAPEQYCVNCETELANYFCSKCVLYDNDVTKDIYHCDKCGICRLGIGLGKDYFHCDECNDCLSIDLRERHRCLTNTTHCDCPICNEYLFTSVHKVVFMKCGHSIHLHCYDEMVKHLYKCPLCKKTVVNVETQFRILDQEIEQSPLPAPYNGWRCHISCNDCLGKSNAAYHVLGLKCKYCKSYNTNQLKLTKPEEEETGEDGPTPDISQQTTAFDLELTQSVQALLQGNFRISGQNDQTRDQFDDDYGADVENNNENGNRNGFEHGNHNKNEDESGNESLGDEDVDGVLDTGYEYDMIDLSKLTGSRKNDDGNTNNLLGVSYIASVFLKFMSSPTAK